MGNLGWQGADLTELAVTVNGARVAVAEHAVPWGDNDTSGATDPEFKSMIGSPAPQWLTWPVGMAAGATATVQIHYYGLAADLQPRTRGDSVERSRAWASIDVMRGSTDLWPGSAAATELDLHLHGIAATDLDLDPAPHHSGAVLRWRWNAPAQAPGQSIAVDCGQRDYRFGRSGDRPKSFTPFAADGRNLPPVAALAERTTRYFRMGHWNEGEFLSMARFAAAELLVARGETHSKFAAAVLVQMMPFDYADRELPYPLRLSRGMHSFSSECLGLDDQTAAGIVAAVMPYGHDSQLSRTDLVIDGWPLRGEPTTSPIPDGPSFCQGIRDRRQSLWIKLGSIVAGLGVFAAMFWWYRRRRQTRLLADGITQTG